MVMQIQYSQKLVRRDFFNPKSWCIWRQGEETFKLMSIAGLCNGYLSKSKNSLRLLQSINPNKANGPKRLCEEHRFSGVR